MTTKNLHINFLELLTSMSEAIELFSPQLTDHHKCVAYIALNIAKMLALTKVEKNNLIIASMLHDIGAIPDKYRLSLLSFDSSDHKRHSVMGYVLFEKFKTISHLSSTVLYHHINWNNGSVGRFRNISVPFSAHIIHLADRVDLLTRRDKKNILDSVTSITATINERSGIQFKPEIVDAFMKLSERESFWLGLTVPQDITRMIAKETNINEQFLPLVNLLDFSKLIGNIIDFRNRFTATHSAGVSIVSEIIGMYMDLSMEECIKLKIAGFFHDIGKLAVPDNILQKPSGLSETEFNVIKQHSFHTYNILDKIGGLEEINQYASFHHERGDGLGYPFRYNKDELSLGSRIVAVADIFTALTEDRPYRSGLDKEQVFRIISGLSERGVLDTYVTDYLSRYYTEINSLRIFAQSRTLGDYEDFFTEVDSLMQYA